VRKAFAPLTMQCVRDASGALTFTLPVPPSANRWWRKWKNRMVLSDEARNYKALVKAAYKRAEIRGEIAVEVTWHRERRSGDLDKRLGVVLDSLQGVAYATDAQIVRLTATRREDPKNPRLIVTVAPALT
jgi:crossover junction endodeoxyribonuclease RusA